MPPLVAIARDLADLSPLFDQLEAGQTVVLGEEMDAPAPPPPSAEEGPWLGLKSSGTSAAPKLCWHRWQELRATAVPSHGMDGWTWASPFRADSYAGVQVALQAWVSRGNCRRLRGDWGSVWNTLEAVRPEVLSCTPTFLDLLLTAAPREANAQTHRWQPRQVTLGGEPLREHVGRRLSDHFPHTRFTVVYASAEAGLIAKTHRLDGWFEVDSLRRHSEAWRFLDGGLELQRHATWHDVGDRVESDGYRFRVLGRAGNSATVAGTKIWLADVEAAAEEVPGLQIARAVAEPNSISGQVIALKFSPLPETDVASLQAALERHLRARLRKEAWPRRWEPVSAGLGPNAKKAP